MIRYRVETRKAMIGFIVVLMLSCICYSQVSIATEDAIYRVRDGKLSLEDGTASIEIQGSEGQSLQGKRFQIYQLFEATNALSLESIQYEWKEECQLALQTVVGERISKRAEEVTEYEVIDYLQSLNTHKVEGAQGVQIAEQADSELRYFIEELRTELKRQGVKGMEVLVDSTDTNHNITISGLEYGYYLVDETTSVAHTHSAASLCMTYTANPDASIQIKSDYPELTKKIQEDDQHEAIGADGWNDIGDYEIGQSVPYRYESRIPDIQGYETYYYVWHDRMDQALTFQPNSVSIQIVGTHGSYQLDDKEFQIVERLDNEDTFQIIIPDLKRIVDREFCAGEGEMCYGQRVILNYEAVLNEDAAVQDGQLGFENDVRLEFSNDPDGDGTGSTGYTPWDTVVCFTYRLQLAKENTGGQRLADAHFRLYRDEACQQEIGVSASEDGYIVHQQEVYQEMVTNEAGELTIHGLDSGIYYLKETKAPDGYRLLQDPIVLTIEAEFPEDRNAYIKGEAAEYRTLLSLQATAHVKQFLEGILDAKEVVLETDVKCGDIQILVVNREGVRLPDTGSRQALALSLTGVGLMIWGMKGRRRDAC